LLAQLQRNAGEIGDAVPKYVTQSLDKVRRGLKIAPKFFGSGPLSRKKSTPKHASAEKARMS
jgi:hypothetical protein